jgi:hypothetical protein
VLRESGSEGANCCATVVAGNILQQQRRKDVVGLKCEDLWNVNKINQSKFS